MQLNEIIEENTLPTISRRTRISVENLEHLVARDWSKMQRVQAMGFLSILEREYHIDLGDLRAECRAHFESHAPEEEENSIAVTVPAEHSVKKKVSRFALLLFLAALGFGSWFLFVEKNESLENNKTVPEKQGFYDSVVSAAGALFRTPKNGRAEENATEVPALKGAWAEKKPEGDNATVSSVSSGEKSGEIPAGSGSERVGDRTASAQKPSDSGGKTSEEGEEEQIIRQVKEEQAKAEEIRQEAAEENFSVAEKNGEEPSDISGMILAATAGVAEEETGKSREKEALETTVPSMNGAEKRTEEKQKSAEESSPEPNRSSASATAAPQTVKAEKGTKGGVLFHPRAKIWVGYTNLRTMKREAKVTAADISFDTAKADYILATGHGKIEFKTSSGIKKLNDGQKHFFMISKGGVREMSHEAFQRLNKSKVW